MDEIKQWLQSGRDYTTGVALYERYGKYQSLVSLLRKQRLPNKLAECLLETLKELKESAEIHTITAAPAAPKPVPNLNSQAAAPESHKTEAELLIEARESDPQFVELDKQWKKVYGEMAAVHTRMTLKVEEDPENTEVIGALAKELHRMRLQLVELWHQRDHFLAHGTFPDAPAKAKKVRKALTQSTMQELLSVRSNVSIKKRELKKIETELMAMPGSSQLQFKLAEKQKQLNDLLTRKQQLENGKV
jgi:hypothetical protein